MGRQKIKRYHYSEEFLWNNPEVKNLVDEVAILTSKVCALEFFILAVAKKSGKIKDFNQELMDFIENIGDLREEIRKLRTILPKS
jgi:hypothetical protein